MPPLLPLIRRIARLQVGWGTVVCLILLAIFHPFFLPFFGYYVNEPGWKVARIAAEKKDVYVCDRLVSSYDNIFISTDELQLDCIREYATLTQDPTACRLLPGPGKLDCVGGASRDIRWQCGLNADRTVVGHDLRVPLRECVEGEEGVRNHPCCRLAVVVSVLPENDCSSLQSRAEFHDECLYRVAFKNHDPASCESIRNPALKTVCTIQAAALRRDPSICDGCLKPVENVEELLRTKPEA